jgi:hypothetical protein
MVRAKPKNSHRGLFRRSEILSLPREYIFSFITSVKITKNFFKQVQLYIILILGIKPIFRDLLLTSYVFRKAGIMLATKYSTIHHADP